MQVLSTILLAIQMLSAIIMIGLILVQHGKGADMGAAFGSGSSGSLFGASGSANFMSRATAVLAGVFFVCTLALAYFSGVRPVGSSSILEKAAVTGPAGTASGAASGVAPIPTGATTPAVVVAPASASATAASAPTGTVQPAAAATSAQAPIPTK
jgi:preprotein translocase subunit SecG